MFCGNCGTKLEKEAKFCQECGEEAEELGSKTREDSTSTSTEDLEERISNLEVLGINNQNLFSRSFAVYGHFIVAQVMVSIIILAIIMFFELISS